MALILEQHEVEGLLDTKRAIEALEAAFIEHSRRKVLTRTPFAVGGGYLRIAVGALLESKVVGARLSLASRFEKGTPLAVIYDSETGELLAVMSFPFAKNSSAASRLGSTVGLATKFLSRKNAEVVGVIGTGDSSMGSLYGIVAVRHVTKIKVYSRDPANRNRFAEQAGSALGITVSPCRDPGEVVKGTDILVVATNSRVPVFDPETIEPGLHINSVGQPDELDPATYHRADLTVVGDKDRELHPNPNHGLTPLLKLKEVDTEFWERVQELGEVVSGVGGRKGGKEISVFRDGSAGWADVALANWILTRAKEMGLGREIAF